MINYVGMLTYIMENVSLNAFSLTAAKISYIAEIDRLLPTV